MSETLPTDKAEDTAIDAEVMERAKCLCDPRYDMGPDQHVIDIARAIHAAKAEGEHYLRYFESLAKVNAAANAALDAARREWAKRGEG